MSTRFRLRDIGATYGGLTGKTKTDFGEGVATFIPFLEVINNPRLSGNALERVKVSTGERQNRVMRGDLIFNGSSETPEEVALSAVVDFDTQKTTYLNSFCFGFRLHPGVSVDPHYLSYFFRSGVGRKLVGSLAQGATRYNIAKTKFLDLELPVPDIGQQRAIADALKNVDDLIAMVERLIAKKQAIKTGMMQQLLTGKTRLPGFLEPWKEVSVSSLGRVVGGGTPSTRMPAYWGGGIPWFTPAEIKADGSGPLSRSERTITDEGLANSAASLLPAGSVLVTSRASIGNCAIAADLVSTNQGFTSLVPKDNRSTWFYYYWVQQNRAAFESRAAGSTFLEISASKVSTIPISVPGLEEQEAIGKVVRDVDTEIEVLLRRAAKVRAIKQGMMQQLLTGRTRLPVEAAA